MLPLDHMDALDAFIGACLVAGGVWASPRTSDGIERVERVLEHGPDALRIYGRLYEIDQSRHAFWLEVHRSGDRIAWKLAYDADDKALRRAAEWSELAWRVALEGDARFAGDVLVPTVYPGGGETAS